MKKLNVYIIFDVIMYIVYILDEKFQENFSEKFDVWYGMMNETFQQNNQQTV